MINKSKAQLLLAIIVCVLLIILVANKNEEVNVLKEIENGKAEVVNVVRALESYTDAEKNKYPDLKKIFNETSKLDSTTNTHNHTKIMYGNIYTSIITTSYGVEVIYRSLPKVTLTGSDIGMAGSSEFSTRFEIIEYVTVNGVIEPEWENQIIFKNLSNKIVCGNNLAFTSSIKISGETDNNRQIIENLLGLDEFRNTVYTNKTGYNENRDITYDKTYITTVDNKNLFNGDHYILIRTSLSTIDSNEAINQSVTSYSKWSFDIELCKSKQNTLFNKVDIISEINHLANFK